MKNWGGLVGLAILVLIIVGALAYKKTDSYDLMSQQKEHDIYDFNTSIRVMQYNMRSFFRPPRTLDGTKRLKAEQDLKQFIPPFKDFRQSDWKKFWKFIYKPKRQRNPFAMRRWRTKSEMESFFKGKFENPFANFSPKHWEHFWSVIEDNKKFKHVVYDDTMTEADQALIDQDKAKLLRTPKSSRIRYDLTK